MRSKLRPERSVGQYAHFSRSGLSSVSSSRSSIEYERRRSENSGSPRTDSSNARAAAVIAFATAGSTTAGAGGCGRWASATVAANAHKSAATCGQRDAPTHSDRPASPRLYLRLSSSHTMAWGTARDKRRPGAAAAYARRAFRVLTLACQGCFIATSSEPGDLTMLTPTNTSWVSRILGAVIALTPLAGLAQRDAAMPPPLAEFLSSLPQVRHLTPATAKDLNRAIAALKAERYDEARAALGELSLDQLTPFERSNTEHILYRIARAEEKYGEARQHILNAIDSGGLNEQEIAHAQERLKEMDAALATAPPT